MTSYYREHGPKETQSIIFVHGGGLGSSSFKLQFEYFSDYHCIAPDLPGHGERHGEQLVSIEQCSRNVAEVIRSVVPEKKAHVVGVSFGAQVVVDLIAGFPEVINRAIVNSCVLKRSVLLERISTWAIILVLKSSREKAFRRYRKMKFPEEMFASMYADSRRITRQNFKTLFNIYFRYRVPEILTESQVPTLILSGTKELGIVKKSMRDLAEILPNNSAYMAKGETHSFAFQNPSLFNETVRAWIEDSTLPDRLIPLQN